MGQDLVTTRDRTALAPVEVVAEKVRDYAAQARAANTVRAYKADWQDFEGWCKARGVSALPAEVETLCHYIAEAADGRKASTLQRRLAAISQAHKLAGHAAANPTQDGRFREVWKGIRRAKGTAPSKKAPTLTADIRAMIETLPDSPAGWRDRSLLLLGFAAALRRNELVTLDIEHLEFNRDGLIVTLPRSKTDQEGEGAQLGVPYGSNPDTCPVRSLQRWLEVAAIGAGPLFRPIDRWGRIGAARLTDQAVAIVVKRTAKAAGFDPERFAGHSLRAGLATAAALADVPEHAIMRQTRQRSVEVFRGYVRVASLFKKNAAAAVGL